MSKTYCNYIAKGMFVSHQGISLCCPHNDKHKNIKPSEFWSGDVRKEALANMSVGDPVKGCNVCYSTEKKKLPSSRNFAKSFDRLPTNDFPTMLDVDFSNFCNLKCVMCNSARSSEWAKDEGLPVSTISYEFIDDLISISNDVQHLVVQGGEASIMPEYEYFFTELHKKGLCQKIDLQIITNATNVNKRFYDLLTTFKSVRLSVSVDAYGTANDYIRWPSKFQQITKNLEKISELPSNVQVDLFNSLNILSMFNYDKFLQWCRDMENLFESKEKLIRIVPLKVQRPKSYSPFSASLPLKEKFINDVKKFMLEDTLKHNSKWKTEMMLLLRSIEESPVDHQAMLDLKHKVVELDAERNKSITDYIPDFHQYV